jgi:hypothetical protein
MVDDVDWAKLPIRPAEPSSSKSRLCGRRKWILSTKYFFHTSGVLLNAVKSYQMGIPALPALRRCAADFYHF